MISIGDRVIFIPNPHRMDGMEKQMNTFKEECKVIGCSIKQSATQLGKIRTVFVLEMKDGKKLGATFKEIRYLDGSMVESPSFLEQ